MPKDSSPKLKSGHSREPVANMQHVFGKGLECGGLYFFVDLFQSRTPALPYRLEQAQARGHRDIEAAELAGHGDRE